MDVTSHTRAFQVMIRNGAFRWIQLFARTDYNGLAAEAVGDLSDPDQVKDLATPYWDDFDEVLTGPDARSSRWFAINSQNDKTYEVEQIICDPNGFNEWRISGIVDLAQSREAGEAVMKLTNIGAL
ncbi:MAG TPA: hypothetical protein DCX77_10375 [Acidimicrobiaceae bacterium]|nr:hypothetical protein [Acidimicrobiaceae bacterium]